MCSPTQCPSTGAEGIPESWQVSFRIIKLITWDYCQSHLDSTQGLCLCPWQPVKEEMNNKVNKVKVANCVNEGYEFPVEEVDYENMDWNEDKEVITTKYSPNEQLSGQAEAPRQRPKWPDPENLQIMCVIVA